MPLPSETLVTRRPTADAGFARGRLASRAVARAAAVLLAAIVLGELVFFAYLAATYGRSTLARDLHAWSHFSAHGWVVGDPVGNAAMAAHVLLAAAVLLAGAVQLMPVVRRRWPRLHRWSGRTFLSGCVVAAVSGLWLVWGRGTVGDTPQHVAISLNAVLLTVCAGWAWQTARTRQFARHRDWALRAYLVAGGVFYFRMLLALWLVLFRRPVGFDADTFSGPFLTILAFGVYVIAPLTLFEGYRRAAPVVRGAAARLLALLLYLLALTCGAGALSAVLVLWLPKLR